MLFPLRKWERRGFDGPLSAVIGASAWGLLLIIEIFWVVTLYLLYLSDYKGIHKYLKSV